MSILEALHLKRNGHSKVELVECSCGQRFERTAENIGVTLSGLVLAKCEHCGQWTTIQDNTARYRKETGDG